MASIEWNDGVSRVLTNGKPAPADRFSDWVPRSVPVGPREHALGTGAMTAYTFRVDYGATFELRQIPHTQAHLADRLRLHLLRGGRCTVNTGDAASRSYAQVELAVGAEPELEQTDPALLEYTLRLAVVRRDGTADVMRCEH